MSLIKWLFGKKESISYEALLHSNIGTYTKESKRLDGGGHGQAAIDYMEQNNIKYNITKTYNNGVRIGNVPTHTKKNKQAGSNQTWFPKSWKYKKIKRAGQLVARGTKLADGSIKKGYYGNVNVGIIRTSGKIATIFPLSRQTNKKGKERKWK